jgi:hypothetical protein
LQSALENVANSDGQTLTLTLQSTPESLKAASEGALTDDQAQQILDSSLTVSAKGDSPENSSFQFLLDIAGTDGVEIRSVDQNFYVRADVRGISDVFGAEAGDIDQFVEQGKAQGLDWVEALADGKWMSLEGAKELLQQFSGASPSADTKLQQKAADALSKALDDSATVTNEGSDDVGDHLVASVNLRSFYSAISGDLGALSGGLPVGQLPSADQVPDTDLKIDIWVADDTVKQIEFDFMQLAALDENADIPEGVDSLAVRLTLDAFDDDVEVPDGAVPVDLKEVVQGMMGSVSSSTEAGSATMPSGTDMSELCDQLKDAPSDVQAQFVEQCPELSNK